MEVHIEPQGRVKPLHECHRARPRPWHARRRRRSLVEARHGAHQDRAHQRARRRVVRGELEGRTKRSSLFKTMFLAFRAAGACDWRSNLAIALDHSGAQHKLQFHHIFPKAVLKKHGWAHREIDDIANLAFVSGRTNRAITDKPPDKYLPGLLDKVGEEAFHAQAMPTDPKLWSLDAYSEFLAARRKLIAKRLNEFLGVGV
jgi:hypothetical protein